MKKVTNLTSKKEIIIHLIFWVIYSYFSLIKFNAEGDLYLDLSLFSLTWFLVFILTFYLNYLWILPRVFDKLNWKKAVIGLATILFSFIFIRFVMEQVLTKILFEKTNYHEDTGIIYYVFDNLYFGGQPIIISTIFWIIISFIRLSEYNSYIIEEQKNTEIKFLKAQINPHFVFNTLNNIYSMVYFKSDKSLEAIEKLGNIMRFTTYESQKDKIEITQEIDYINSYIELESFRHTPQNFVNFEIESKTKNPIMISPYILSPLVENALKHGIISNEKTIDIKLYFDDEKLIFKVVNYIGNHKKDKLGGIGIDNLKKRLDINYPKKNKLDSFNEKDIFTANLQIDLR